MAARMRAFDWASTPLGPAETWPQSLRTAVRILLSSRFAMWMAWGEGLTFFYNDAYRPTLGVKDARALGAPASEVWAEIWKDIGPRVEHVLATGEATWDEALLLIMERSGFREETYHTFSYSPLADDEGRITGMLCVVTEETERVIGERRLATLAELAAGISKSKTERDVTAAAAAALGANGKDLPFTLVYLFEDEGRSARLLEQTGFGRDAAPPPGVIDVASGTWGADRCWRAEGRFVVDIPERRPAPGGAFDVRPRQAAVTPVADQGQRRPAGFLVAGINPLRPLDRAYGDFIDLVAGQIASGLAGVWAYEAERQRAQALAEIDEAKTLFFSNVSHEFRTPLTLLLGPLEEVLQGAAAMEPAALRASVALAHRNALRLLRLVNSLLDFSRIEAGRVQACFEPTDLAAYVAELVSSFRSATDRAGLALEVRTEDLGGPVWVDREMVEKIVLNLVSNAFKFTFTGGIAVTVRSSSADTVEVAVADTGVGIPADELPRLFERFHRVEGVEGRSFEGSGIGLALVDELVKLHGGAITVESAPGQGTRFAITLRRGTAHLPPDRLARDASAPAAASGRARAFVEEALRWLPEDAGPEPEDESRGAGRGRRILLADDNGDMRSYVARLLRQDGYAVETAEDGAEALAALRRTRPDLLLSDVMMPQLDGFGLLAAVRSDPELADLPVILLSARAGEEAAVEGLAAGADDYLTKPFAARELLARISANLALAHARRSAGLEAAARAAELQAVLDTAPVAVWFTADADARRVRGNAFAARLLRRTPDPDGSFTADQAERPRHFRICRKGLEAAADTLPMPRAVGGEEVRDDELEVIFDDGSRISILVSATALRDHDGAVRGAIATAVDITDRKRAEEHRMLLINELNHRVKNTLATVQSVALQTFSVHKDQEAFREAFEARLMSLSRAHDVLTQENWEGADLIEIFDRVLAPYATGPERRIARSGEDVRLTPKAALGLAMAFHELATNAAKYGALSRPEGRVLVDWRVVRTDGERALELVWRETGGPPVRPPTRRGFGTRLLERGLARDLDGEVKLAFEPPGVVCRVRASLAPLGPAWAVPDLRPAQPQA
jgi:signal transduction histidine kinase/DNA-binding response OmpR family regulator